MKDNVSMSVVDQGDGTHTLDIWEDEDSNILCIPITQEQRDHLVSKFEIDEN